MQVSPFDPRTASLTNLTTYLEKQVGKNISEKAEKKIVTSLNRLAGYTVSAQLAIKDGKTIPEFLPRDPNRKRFDPSADDVPLSDCCKYIEDSLTMNFLSPNRIEKIQTVCDIFAETLAEIASAKDEDLLEDLKPEQVKEITQIATTLEKATEMLKREGTPLTSQILLRLQTLSNNHSEIKEILEKDEYAGLNYLLNSSNLTSSDTHSTEELPIAEEQQITEELPLPLPSIPMFAQLSSRHSPALSPRPLSRIKPSASIQNSAAEFQAIAKQLNSIQESTQQIHKGIETLNQELPQLASKEGQQNLNKLVQETINIQEQTISKLEAEKKGLQEQLRKARSISTVQTLTTAALVVTLGALVLYKKPSNS